MVMRIVSTSLSAMLVLVFLVHEPLCAQPPSGGPGSGGSLSGRVEALEAAVAALTGEITELQAVVTNLAARVDALEAGFGSGIDWELVQGTVTFGQDSLGLLPCPSGKLAVNGGDVRTGPSGSGEFLFASGGSSSDGSGWLLGGPPGGVTPAWVTCIRAQ